LVEVLYCRHPATVAMAVDDDIAQTKLKAKPIAKFKCVVTLDVVAVFVSINAVCRMD
jgi:hypothetical protein